MFLIFSIAQISGQNLIINQKFNKFNFLCNNEDDSILLPSYFHGPYYFQYTEGSIISFSSSDSCFVRILCGADADFAVDTLYVTIDSLVKNNIVRQYTYYNNTKNLFARKDYRNRFIILYENASPNKKKDLDIAFDSLLKK
jgi:hypothetical protein